jgi:hypothetical protein
VNKIRTMEPCDSRFMIPLVEGGLGRYIFAATIDDIGPNANLWVRMPGRKVDVVEISYCIILEIDGIEIVTEDPGSRTVADSVLVVQVVLVTVVSIVDELNEDSEYVQFDVLQLNSSKHACMASHSKSTS